MNDLIGQRAQKAGHKALATPLMFLMSVAMPTAFDLIEP